MVPKGWSLRCLGDITDTVMGFAFKSEDFVPEGVQLIRMGNLYQNQLQLDRNPVYLPIEFIDKYKKFTLMPNELIMSMTGTMGKRDYGFTVQIPPELPVTMLNQRVMKFIPKHQTNIQYLLHLLRSDLILARLYAFPGGTKQANLSAQQVQELSAPVPPLEEQRKIAQILSTWDKAITTTERLLTNRQQQKKALMQRLLTGKQRFAGFEGKWMKSPLSHMVDIDPESLNSKTHPEYQFFYISLSDVNAGTISSSLPFIKYSDSPSRARRVIRTDDVLLATVRPNLQGFAITTPVHNGYVASTGFAVLRAKSGFSAQYVYQYLWSEHLTNQITSIVVGTNYPAINSSDVADLVIKYPQTIDEQQKIASVLSAADAEITTIQNQLNNLKQQKKALMQQLLTGKRRVKVDSPALATQ